MISYQSIAQESVSFYASAELEVGTICKMNSADTVTKALKDDAFIGVVAAKRGTLTSVTVRGFVTAKYSGTTPAVGMVALCTGEGNTVCTAESGQIYLVVNVNPQKKTVTFLL